jgi:hypothetical protein
MGIYSNGCVPVGAFRALPGLTAQAPWFYFPVNYRIESFSVEIRKRSGTLSPKMTCTGPLFSQQVMQHFSNLQIGERVWIDDILVKPPDGTTHKEALSFTVCN